MPLLPPPHQAHTYLQRHSQLTLSPASDRERGGFWAGFTATVFAAVLHLAGRIDARGGGLIPATGAALLVSNHVSHLDPLLSSVFIYRAGRIPRFLAKHGIWDLPIARRVMTATSQIPVYRDSADAQHSLRAATQALHDGKLVLIYPEGTITRDPDHWPMHSHTGVARLALTSNTPVLPMAHWGTHQIYDHYHRRFRPLPRKTMTIRCGPPIDLSAYRNRTIDTDLLRQVTDHLMTAVRDLLAEIRDEPAPASFHRRNQP